MSYPRMYKYCLGALPSLLFLIVVRLMEIPSDVLLYSVGFVLMLLVGYALVKSTRYYVVPKNVSWIRLGRKTTFSDSTLLVRYQEKTGLYEVYLRNDRTSQTEMIWRSSDKSEVVELLEVAFACIVDTTVINEDTGEFRYSQRLGSTIHEKILEKEGLNRDSHALYRTSEKAVKNETCAF